VNTALDDAFAGDALDPARWLPRYLPHWSSGARAAARYEVADGLRLLIEHDQEPWCPEWDGDTRVSALQTGVHAGPLGSPVGQHRFHPDAVVREEQETRWLYTPQYARVAIRCRALADPRCMVALWMIGIEDVPEHSAEICVCEIFGRDVGSETAKVGMGVHPFGDPSIADDFEQVELPIDAREPHTYEADWTPDRVVFLVDGRRVKVVDQSPAYPMQLMLTVYEFAGEEPRDPADYPKAFPVERVTGRPSGR
jgi:hypothetical protein